MILSIASGKGGTGKTLVASSFALSLEEQVQLLDCDVEEPNAHVFLRPVFTGSERVCVPIPVVDENKCNYCGKCAEVCAYNAIAVVKTSVLVFPQLCHGCGACSYFCPEDAISEVGREIGIVETGYSESIEFAHGKLNVGEAMAPPVIRKLKDHINDKGTVIIDAPPGTSCPVVESVKGSDFCILVTEPTPFGLNDLTLMVEVTRKLDIPCGILVNRSRGDDANIKQYCLDEGIPILLTIPLDRQIAYNYSRGITLVEGFPQWREKFLDLYRRITDIVSSQVTNS
ncbi:MAG: ATP-binding protein [Chloroflexota bacterium]|nr:ATP-binding protein [Chloroflexota bacterium]